MAIGRAPPHAARRVRAPHRAARAYLVRRLRTRDAVTTTAGFDSAATYRHSGHHSPAKYSATCRPAKRLHSTRAPLWFRREAPENRHCCGCVGAANVDSRHSIVRRSAQTTSSRSVRGGRLGALSAGASSLETCATCGGSPPRRASSHVIYVGRLHLEATQRHTAPEFRVIRPGATTEFITAPQVSHSQRSAVFSYHPL